MSCLRVFASLFDTQNLSPLDKSKQNLLLRNLILSLRFPPAVRCMYALINRQTSPPEDRAALAQSLFLYGRTIHEIATREFDFRDSQVIFITLYRQLSQREPEPSTSLEPPFQYVDAFESLSLSCDVTNNKAISGICMRQFDAPVLIDQSISDYYVKGPLKRTLFGDKVTSLLSERISTFSGGRFREITYIKYPLEVPAHSISDSPLNFSVSTPLEVVAPKDLQSTTPPVLSRDARGRMCVYTGTDLGECSNPPFKCVVPRNLLTVLVLFFSVL